MADEFPPVKNEGIPSAESQIDAVNTTVDTVHRRST